MCSLGPPFHLSLVLKGRSSGGQSCLEMGSATSPRSELLTNQRGWLLGVSPCLLLFFSSLGVGVKRWRNSPQKDPGVKYLDLKINRGPTTMGQQGLAQACLQIPGGLGRGCRIPGSPPDPETASPPPSFLLVSFRLFPTALFL